MAKIRNKRTGEIREVPDSELGDYGIVRKAAPVERAQTVVTTQKKAQPIPKPQTKQPATQPVEKKVMLDPVEFKKDKVESLKKVAEVKSTPKPKSEQSPYEQTLDLVTQALAKEGITDPNTIAYAMATIEHETANTFQPIAEYGGRQQAKKYGYGGGENYYGRGYIQLTHDDNYRDIGNRIGLGDQLVENPDMALDPDIAAQVLAAFFKDRGVTDYTQKGDFYNARRPVNKLDKAQKIADRANYYRSTL